MTITSAAFEAGTNISERYTCDGLNHNPPLKFHDVPLTAKSLTVIMDDPDAPTGNFTHWLVWNIDPHITEIKENDLPEKSVVGRNSFDKMGYGGPCPPTGRAHHYQFRVYALDTTFDISPTAPQSELESLIQKHAIESASLVGTYARSSIPR